MLTMAQQLAADAKRIKDDIRILLGEHSRIRIHEADDGPVISLSPKGNNYWEELPIEGRRLQTKILKDYGRYRDLVRSLITGVAEDLQRRFAEADEAIQDNVKQEYGTSCTTREEAIEETRAAFDRIEDLIDGLYSSEGMSLVVPDTNALLANPDLPSWRFDWCESFEIILLPTILGELDKLKVTARGEDTRDKVKGIIRQIKDLGRRADLQRGVPVLEGRITARSVAIEPKVTEALPWLDSTNEDDRFLASVIELIRENVRSIVVIVTLDVNLQNKARLARLPFCEPPPRPEKGSSDD